jgi:hypothetical protein
MKKPKIIEKIKSIISEWGGVSTGEIPLAGTPVYNRMGKHICALVEYFSNEDVEVSTYVNDIETESINVNYEDLKKPLLIEILDILIIYDADQKKKFF